MVEAAVVQTENVISVLTGIGVQGRTHIAIMYLHTAVRDSASCTLTKRLDKRNVLTGRQTLWKHLAATSKVW